MWNDLPSTVFDTGTSNGFKEAVDPFMLPLEVFFSVFRSAGVIGFEKKSNL